MKTSILDQYIFTGFEKIKMSNVDFIDFNLKADRKIDTYLITNLFQGIDIILLESEEIERHFFIKKEYSIIN